MADETATPATGDDDGYGTLDELTALETPVEADESGGEAEATEEQPAAADAPTDEQDAAPAAKPAPEPWQVAIEAMQQQNMEFQRQMLDGFKEAIGALRPTEPEKPAAPVDRYEAMARQALGEHAPPEMLRDVAGHYKRLAAFEAHEGTDTAKAPEFQRAAAATKQDLARTEAMARAFSEERAARQALERRLEEMEQRPVREATLQTRKQDVRAFLLADHDLYKGENDVAARLFPKLSERVRASGAWEPVAEMLLAGTESMSDPAEYREQIKERASKLDAVIAAVMAEKSEQDAALDTTEKTTRDRVRRKAPPNLNGKDGRTPAPPPDDDDSYGSIRDLM